MNIFNTYPKYEEAGADGGDGGSDAGTGDASGDGGDAGAQANWYDSAPETWRTDLITKAGYEGEDAVKVGNMLERSNDPASFLKSAVSAQDMIRKGELSSGLPDNPSEEQLNDWRSANGVPLEPSYELSLGDGVTLSESEQGIFDEVFKSAHAGNVNTDTMNQMAVSFKQAQQVQEDKRLAQDGIDSQQGVEVLKKAWGGEFDANMNRANARLNALPDAVRESLVGGRMGDGKGMMNSPEVLEWLSGMERQINPAGTVVPNAANPVQAIKDELASLKEKIGTEEWFKDQDSQDRYQQLLEAQGRMTK